VPIPVHPTEPAGGEDITPAELALATRNHGMPLEAMRWDLTPVGLHYLLVHYDVPLIDAASWRLQVRGSVEHGLDLTLDDLRQRPATTVAVTMECAGNGRALLRPRALSQPWLLEAVGTAEWTGVPLAELLADAGPTADAGEVVFTGADRGVEAGVEQDYERALSVQDALGSGALLVYEMNGAPLPPQHGYPLRLVVPGWYGMTNVKWLSRITLVDEPHRGYQNDTAYRLRASRDDPGQPLSRIAPRSLVVPPGIPDFFSRHRLVPRGPCLVEGRAWSGWAPIDAVAVSADGGTTWHDAELAAAPRDPHAWRRFSWEWTPDSAGDFELRSRCRDAAGNRQPDEAEWNLGGYANNAVQRVLVTVSG
jgi:DMSO/TMAO reductase YedYZ molybdopterin-dependent catalytic subunit